MKKIRSLFILKTKFEVFCVIYALSLGATERGLAYIGQYPGWSGKLLALACTGSVFLAGGLMIDAVDIRQQMAPDR